MQVARQVGPLWAHLGQRRRRRCSQRRLLHRTILAPPSLHLHRAHAFARVLGECPRRLGGGGGVGLRDCRSRALAGELLSGLLGAVFTVGGGGCFQIDFDASWRLSWPGPARMPVFGVRLSIRGDGIVELSPWWWEASKQQYPKAHPLKSWLRAVLKGLPPDATEVPVAALLGVTRLSNDLQALYTQLLLCLGRYLDGVAKASSEQSADPKASFVCSFADGEQGMMVANLNAYMFARHLEAAKYVTQGAQYLSIMADKAAARGCTLTNSLAVTPGNDCMVLPPTVVLWGTCARTPPPPGTGTYPFLVYTTLLVYTLLLFLLHTNRGVSQPSVFTIRHACPGPLRISPPPPPPAPCTWGRNGRSGAGTSLKVDRHFEMEVAASTGVDKATRAEMQNLRHRLWRKRGRNGAQESWRPRKRYRVATAKFLRCVDRQAQLGTSLDGLQHLFPSGSPVWSHWKSMPHLPIASDQGTDCVTAGLCGLVPPEICIGRHGVLGSVPWRPPGCPQDVAGQRHVLVLVAGAAHN